MHRDTHMHNDLDLNLLRKLLMKQLKIMTKMMIMICSNFLFFFN